MGNARRERRAWRPGPDTAIALAALVLCAGGVGWAATRDTSTPVITACADTSPGAGNTLHLLTTGSCGGAQTQVQWNQQGPQGQVGPQGPPGASNAPIVAATLAQKFLVHFFVTTTITTPGSYLLEGSVTEHLSTRGWSPKVRRRTVHCFLQSGPQNGLATRLRDSYQFYLRGNGGVFSPSSFNGPVSLASVITVAPSSRRGSATVVGFGCITYPGFSSVETKDSFVGPTITATPVSRIALAPQKVPSLH